MQSTGAEHLGPLRQGFPPDSWATSLDLAALGGPLKTLAHFCFVVTSYLGVVHLTTFLSPSAAQVISPPMLALAVVLFPIWIVLCLTTHDRREVITFAPQWCRRLAQR